MSTGGTFMDCIIEETRLTHSLTNSLSLSLSLGVSPSPRQETLPRPIFFTPNKYAAGRYGCGSRIQNLLQMFFLVPLGWEGIFEPH